MSQKSSQQRALQEYRSRLSQRGLARFEVLGLDADRELVRSLAKRLAEDDAASKTLREAVKQALGAGTPAKGGVLAALRRSPLVGAELDLSRPWIAGRKVEL